MSPRDEATAGRGGPDAPGVRSGGQAAPIRRLPVHAWRWLLRQRRLGIPWLLLLALATAAAWVFLEIADAVQEGTLRGFDEAVLLAMRAPDDPGDPWGPGWLEEAARDYTALGGFPILSLVTIAVTGFLALRRRWRFAIAIPVSVVGGWLFNTLLKQGFARPRPALVPHLVEVYSLSFPSGHAMMAATTWLTLAALLVHVTPGRRTAAFVLGLAVLVTLVVGVTRVYLGVHWPSDVIAGWTAGATWAVICSVVALRLGRAATDDGPA